MNRNELLIHINHSYIKLFLSEVNFPVIANPSYYFSKCCVDVESGVFDKRDDVTIHCCHNSGKLSLGPGWRSFGHLAEVLPGVTII